MEFVIVLAILCAVVLFVSSPLWRRTDEGPQGDPERAARAAEDGPAPELAELEAAREAKYREIRDAELDYRTGKLSEADYEAIDRTLRGEAIEIMRAIDQAQAR